MGLWQEKDTLTARGGEKRGRFDLKELIQIL